MKNVKTFDVYGSVLILAGIILCLMTFPSCNRQAASRKEPARFYQYRTANADLDPGDENKFEFSNYSLKTDGKGRLVFQYEKKNRLGGESLGQFFMLSNDGGKTFGREYEFTRMLNAGNEVGNYRINFVPDGFAVITLQNGNLFYSHADENLTDWSDPVQINDEQNAYLRGGILLQPNENEVYCVWGDGRRGFELIFFAASHDGGKTWSPNQPIDHDFREGLQQISQFVLGADDRLLVFWMDWRDRKTLIDIRYSFSDDQGQNWTPSQKLNDDAKEVWQVAPTAVADGFDIYLAFADFREEGEAGDNDWNIYFAHSSDNGTSWEKNKRLNDVKDGRDEIPKLAIDQEGNLYCLWWTSRDTIFGQLAFSYSNDRGASWSPSVALTPPDEMIENSGLDLHSVSAGKFIFRAIKQEYGKSEVLISVLEKTSDPIVSERRHIKEPAGEAIAPLRLEIGETLFADDFSGETAEKWESKAGFWAIENGTFMGVMPKKGLPFIAFAKLAEPERYVLRGRFKLDSFAHTAASIYFRTNQTGLRYYVITNRFRHGAWLSEKNNDLPGGLHISGGKPLAQKRFPFQNNRWYGFTLVVAPEQIDYYVDESLAFSFKGKLVLPPEKFGIGGYYSSPTYFDDLTVSELK